MVDFESIELIVGDQYYSSKLQKNIQYQRGVYELDCSGNQSGIMVAANGEMDDFYYFNYFNDIFLYSRRESFNSVYENICNSPNDISLIIDQKSDSLMGIILY